MEIVEKDTYKNNKYFIILNKDYGANWLCSYIVLNKSDKLYDVASSKLENMYLGNKEITFDKYFNKLHSEHKELFKDCEADSRIIGFDYMGMEEINDVGNSAVKLATLHIKNAIDDLQENK